MTLVQMSSLVGRRWLVMSLGLLLTAFICVSVYRTSGPYWAYTKVLVLPPAAPQANPLAPESGITLEFVGLIQTEINGGSPSRDAADPDVTLVDQGIYDGWSVRLPNKGGQWANNFEEGTLIVQASGPSQDVVQRRMDHLLGRIQQIIEDREEAAGVAGGSRISLQFSPATVTIQHSRGHPGVATAVVMVVGLGLSYAACALGDRTLNRLRTRGDRHA